MVRVLSSVPPVLTDQSVCYFTPAALVNKESMRCVAGGGGGGCCSERWTVVISYLRVHISFRLVFVGVLVLLLGCLEGGCYRLEFAVFRCPYYLL